MTIRIALLGAGRIGQVHAATVAANPHTRLVAVADVSQNAAMAAANAFGGDVKSIPAIAADKDIDAVLICTPTNTHADLIQMFAPTGKAIFCEKPVDLDVARVIACLEVTAATQAHLMIGFNRRFDPHFKALKHAIDGGRIGTVEMINIISRDPGPPPPAYIKASGGIFKDMTIHDIDMARYLLGEEIDAVMAVASVLIDPAIGRLGDHDCANVILTSTSGKLCAISNSRRATFGYDQRIEVHGSAGMVSAENQREASIEVATADGFTKPPLFDFFMSRYPAAYTGEIEAFVASLTDGSTAIPDGHDGLMALAIAEAAQLSVKEDRKVRLSEVL